MIHGHFDDEFDKVFRLDIIDDTLLNGAHGEGDAK
jgi:hypothetical protein